MMQAQATQANGDEEEEEEEGEVCAVGFSITQVLP